MRPKPNRTYSSDDLAILSRVLKEALKEKIDGAAISDEQLQDLGSRFQRSFWIGSRPGRPIPKHSSKQRWRASGRGELQDCWRRSWRIYLQRPLKLLVRCWANWRAGNFL